MNYTNRTLEHLHSQGHIDKSEKTSSTQTHTHTCTHTHKVILSKVANSSKSTTEITVITNILPAAKSFSPEEHFNENSEQNVPLYEHNNTSKSQLGECAVLESKRPNYRRSLKFFAPEKWNDESKERIHPIWIHLKIIIVLLGTHKIHDQNYFLLEKNFSIRHIFHCDSVISVKHSFTCNCIQ